MASAQIRLRHLFGHQLRSRLHHLAVLRPSQRFPHLAERLGLPGQPLLLSALGLTRPRTFNSFEHLLECDYESPALSSPLPTHNCFRN